MDSEEHYIFRILNEILPRKYEFFFTCSVDSDYRSFLVLVVALELVHLYIAGDKCTIIASCGYSYI